jgi:hypothetical protein
MSPTIGRSDPRQQARRLEEMAAPKPQPKPQPDSGGAGLHPQDHRVTGHHALSQEERRARDRRNLAIGLALGAFVLLIFLITMSRLQDNIAGGGAL